MSKYKNLDSKMFQPVALITGGAGFIGFHLCKSLLEKGKKVLCIDNFLTGRKKNLEIFLDNKNFQSLEKDITKPLDISSVDEIYNLACPASPVHYQANHIQTIETNILGIKNVLELAKKTNCKVLQASTSEVYGNPLEHPQKETYFGNVNPFGLRSCYDEGKRLAESYCFAYQLHYNLDIKIVRIFNTYGPNMLENDGRVVSNFIVQALKNEDITIYGDGSQTRSFCFIDDLIKGMIDLMEQKSNLGPVNLGNDQEFTVQELAHLVLQETKSKSNIIYKELPTDDPICRKPDLKLAREKLNYKPKISLLLGLKKTIEYFKKAIEFKRV